MTGAFANSPEIEAKRGNLPACKAIRYCSDHTVVHGAAHEWVRVRYQGAAMIAFACVEALKDAIFPLDEDCFFFHVILMYLRRLYGPFCSSFDGQFYESFFLIGILAIKG
jgi:hypothetical protein